MGRIEQFRDPELATDGSVVGFYEREFFVFSNFSSFQVEWRGELWGTSEQAYQAARFMGADEKLVDAVRASKSAHEAYRIMQANRDRELPNWKDIKSSVMLDICRHKLQQHDYVRQKLLETGDMLIVEDSPKDPYWGWGPDRQGRNELGTIWMKLREELKHENV